MTILALQLLDTCANVKTAADAVLLNSRFLASYTKEKLHTTREDLLEHYVEGSRCNWDPVFKEELWAIITLLTEAISVAPSIKEVSKAYNMPVTTKALLQATA